MSNIFVNTLVFAEQHSVHNQEEYIRSISSKNIKNIEIRRDFFHDVENEIQVIGELVAKEEINLYYSVPDTLFDNNSIDQEKLKNYLSEAKVLHSKTIKLSVGEYDGISAEDEKFLQEFTNNGIQLFVENDQTEENGRVEKLSRFLNDAKEKNLNVKATFDVGNFSWVLEDAKHNAEILKEFVQYVHFKDVIMVDGKPQTRKLGEGELDIPFFKDFFKGLTFGIEYPCGNDPLDIIEVEIEKLK